MLLTITFWFFALLALGGAVAVLLTRNVLHAAYFLLLTLLAVAALFVLASADFLAVAHLMLYVGGVLVLILFGIMLTRPALRSTTEKGRVLARHRSPIVALGVAGATFAVLYSLLARLDFVLLSRPAFAQSTLDTLARQLVTTYSLPFELAGILLLAALVGGAYLALPGESSQNTTLHD